MRWSDGSHTYGASDRRISRVATMLELTCRHSVSRPPTAHGASHRFVSFVPSVLRSNPGAAVWADGFASNAPTIAIDASGGCHPVVQISSSDLVIRFMTGDRVPMAVAYAEDLHHADCEE